MKQQTRADTHVEVRFQNMLQQSDGSQQFEMCSHCRRALAVAVPCHMHLPGFVTSAELPLSIATPDSVCPGAP